MITIELTQIEFILAFVFAGLLILVLGSIVFVFAREKEKIGKRAHDLLETIQLQQNIIRKGERLARAFETVASLSHELSQPLTHALLSVGLLAEHAFKTERSNGGILAVKDALERTQTIIGKFAVIRDVVSKEYLDSVQVFNLEKSLKGPFIQRIAALRKMHSLRDELENLGPLMARPLHLINNHLTLISAQAEIFLREQSGSSPEAVVKLLKGIVQESQEMGSLVRRYFWFIKEQRKEQKLLDLHALASEMAWAAGERLGKPFFTVGERLLGDFRMLRGDAWKLEEALFSLFLFIGERNKEEKPVFIEPYSEEGSFGFQMKMKRHPWEEEDEEYLQLVSSLFLSSALHLEHDVPRSEEEVFRIRCFD